MQIRKTTTKDIPEVLNIIAEAKAYFKAQGIDQWQGPYPLQIDVEEDIEKGIGYVAEEEGIVGICSISFEADPNYTIIEQGQWLNEEPYGVIHRIAILPEKKGQGIAQAFFQYAEDQAIEKGIYNLRVDTHADNLVMQTAITKFGFTYCGIVYVEDGSLRNAYQKEIFPSNQIVRIQRMERLFDHLKEQKENIDVKELHHLDQYYRSPLWRYDYECDEEGKIPKGLKRGVLSQDELYNFLSEYQEVLK